MPAGCCLLLGALGLTSTAGMLRGCEIVNQRGQLPLPSLGCVSLESWHQLPPARPCSLLPRSAAGHMPSEADAHQVKISAPSAPPLRGIS